ncbi:MAG: efflux RND transporter periplasmic adaptor subunit [Deltaproteobacteria bacterium]
MNRYTAMTAGWLPICLLSCAVIAGCGNSQAQSGPPKPEPPEVDVSRPITATVTDYEYFPGRLVARRAVDVRARVTGYLEKVNFIEGSDVESGQVLCEIDPRPYEAERDRAEGNVIQSRGRLKRLEEEYERAKVLHGKGALSKEEMARVTGDLTEAKGLVKVNEAALELAELNLEFTKVKAPISGRISSRAIDPGNLVKADDTSLTSIVSLNPIYATFDLDERSLLRLKKLIRDGKIKWSLKEDEGLPVHLGLADEDGFPHENGVINFADNRVDADTGTWRLRGEFPNPDLNPDTSLGHIPEYVFAPGMFVRIRLPMGKPYQAVLVAEAALGTDQGQKYLYVVDQSGAAQRRDIKVGQLYNGLRVIAEGLATSDQVVVSGLQRVRNGMAVKATPVPMPGTQAENQAPQSGGETKENGEKK